MIHSVSIRYKGTEWNMPRLARHHDVIAFIHSETGDINIQGEQGFLASDGGVGSKFVDRREAARIAFEAGQIKEAKDELYSEDLW